MATAAHLDVLLTSAQVCAFFGITKRTLENWRTERKIRFIKFGHRTVRYRREWLEEFLQSTEIQQQPFRGHDDAGVHTDGMRETNRKQPLLLRGALPPRGQGRKAAHAAHKEKGAQVQALDTGARAQGGHPAVAHGLRGRQDRDPIAGADRGAARTRSGEGASEEARSGSEVTE